MEFSFRHYLRVYWDGCNLPSELMDLEQPHKVVARCNKPILSPREDYERIGDVGNVVFACGAVVEDTGEIKVYYGAADTCICVATANFNNLVKATFNKDEGNS